MMILDEGAYISPSFYVRDVLPILQRKNSALVVLSTLSEDDDNVFNRLVNWQSDGQSFFRVLKFDPICDRCRRQDKSYCHHRAYMVPHWIGVTRRNELIELSRAMGYGDAAKVEMLNLGDASDYIPAFNRAKLVAIYVAMCRARLRGPQFALAARYFTPTPLTAMLADDNTLQGYNSNEWLYLSFDPAAGGEGSYSSIVVCRLFKQPNSVISVEIALIIRTPHLVADHHRRPVVLALPRLEVRRHRLHQRLSVLGLRLPGPCRRAVHVVLRKEEVARRRRRPHEEERHQSQHADVRLPQRQQPRSQRLQIRQVGLARHPPPPFAPLVQPAVKHVAVQHLVERLLHDGVRAGRVASRHRPPVHARVA